MNNSIATPRYDWIDQAKAFAIFSVMMAHAGSFVFHTPDTFIYCFIDTYFMPVFFFCSGYLGLKLLGRTECGERWLQRKDLMLLVPFFVLGTAYVTLSDVRLNGTLTQSSHINLLLSEANWGYWFIPVLFLFKVAMLMSQAIVGTFVKKTRMFVGVHVSFVAKMLLSIPLAYFLTKVFSQNYYTTYYYLFYLIGFMFRQYNLMEKLEQNKGVVLTIVLLFIVLFTASFFVDNSWRIPYACSLGTLMTPFVRLCSSLSIVLVISRLKIEKSKILGTYSLEIYSLHYFFLLGTDIWLPNQSIAGLPWITQTLLMFVVACVLCVLSVGLAKVIQAVPYLSKITIGR